MRLCWIQMLLGLLLCAVSVPADAVNEKLSGRIRLTSFQAMSNPDLPRIYVGPDVALRVQLDEFLSSNGYKLNGVNSPIDLAVQMRKFGWENFLGTFIADITVQYTLSGVGFSKTITHASVAKASFGDIAWGSTRSDYVMKQVATDSVSKFAAFLETISILEQGSVAPEPNKNLAGDLSTARDAKTEADQRQAPASGAPVHSVSVPQQEPVLAPQSVTNDRLSFDASKKKCAELGFKPATEGFGKCVLQLSK